MEVWKSFEQNEITHSLAHHLMAVDDLLKKQGYARVTDVARYLNITKGSASISLKNLKDRGLIKEDENRFIRLTETGLHTAHAVESKRKVLIKFLIEILRVDPLQAEIDACKIEHLISNTSGMQILQFLQFVYSNRLQSKAFIEEFKEFQRNKTDSESCSLCGDTCGFTELCDAATENPGEG